MEVGSRNASANFQGSGIGKPAFKLYWRDKFCEDKNGEDFVESAPKRSKPVDVGFITPVKDLKRQFETFQLAAQKVSPLQTFRKIRWTFRDHHLY